MTRVNFLPGRFGACLVGFAVIAGPLAGGAALAQTVSAPKTQKAQKAQAPAKGGEAAAKPSDKSAAEQAYATGVRAYEAGKLPEAVTALSNALMSGGLPNPQMARALYLRGLSYRQQGQPALAYTDLTSALWLKNGLQDPDRAKAMTERDAVHREAGLGDQAPPIPGGDGGKPKVATAQAASPTAPKPGVDIASAPTGSNFLETINPMNLFSSNSPQQKPAQVSPPVAAAAPAPSASVAAEPATSSWSTSSSPTQATAVAASAPAAGYAEPAPPSQQASSSQDPLSSATNAVGGFLGTLFGGAPATSEPSSPMVTASTGGGSPRPAMAAPAVAPAPPAAAAAVPWSNPDAAAESAAPAAQAAPPVSEKKASKVKVAAAAPGPQAKAIKPSASGKYKLQVATVASREEADKIASTVSQNPLISGSQPEVDSVVYGNMGTFFRVRVGPYASSAQPAELCKQLRPQGYDCLVVTQ